MSAPKDVPALTIGDAASASGVPAKTIRYYEQIALMPPPHRASNGYRLYSQATVERLRFIKRARDLGFPISDVSELLSLDDNPNRSAGDVRKLAQAHIAAIDAKLGELSQMRQTLSSLVSRCQGGDRHDCPILDDLTHHQEPQ